MTVEMGKSRLSFNGSLLLEPIQKIIKLTPSRQVFF